MAVVHTHSRSVVNGNLHYLVLVTAVNSRASGHSPPQSGTLPAANLSKGDIRMYKPEDHASSSRNNSNLSDNPYPHPTLIENDHARAHLTWNGDQLA